MYAIQHAQAKNLWLHRNFEQWTADSSVRAEFASLDEASDAAELYVNCFDGYTIVRTL